jgi:hypothetical protein
MLEQRVGDLGYFSNLFRRQLPFHGPLSRAPSFRSAIEQLDRVAFIVVA